VQWSTVLAGSDFIVCATSGSSGTVSIDSDEGIEVSLALGDLLEASIGKF
jgi:hypothetical protein